MAGLRFIHVARYASKAEAGEVFELVVRFEDVTDLVDGLSILIVIIKGVERRRVLDLAVRSSEVDSYGEGNLPARAQVVDEVRVFNHSEVIEV